MGMVVQPLTTSAMKIGRENGGNALNAAVEPQKCKYTVDAEMTYANSTRDVLFGTMKQWKNEENDERVLRAVFEFGNYLRETATNMGILLPFIFMNHATATQDPVASYGPEHIARLKDVSKKYYAQQVFQNFQGDGFLLRKV